MDILSFFANPTLRDVGAIALLSGVVVMILVGRLIPKGTHDRIVATAVKRGDEWKATAEDQREVNAVIRGQNGDLIESNKTLEAFLRASGPGPAGGAS